MEYYLKKKIKLFQKMIDEHEYIVFFGGAGVSTESGIPDYRSTDGIDRQPTEYGFTPEQMRHHDFLMNYPEIFFKLYRDGTRNFKAKPNFAHIKLAELERAGKLKAVITQNVDGLHQDAGSKNVYEIHGSRKRMYCIECGCEYDLEYIMKTENIPVCEKCGGMVRPDMVLFGEKLKQSVIDRAVNALKSADMLIIGGTSLVVYPAAGLIRNFKGDCTVNINREEIQLKYKTDLFIRGSIGEVFSKITASFFQSNSDIISSAVIP